MLNHSRHANAVTGFRRCLRPGFTLIELLIVIAIIGILAAILFPVFARARERARRASCQSNLKQLGLAARMYADDYDDHPFNGSGFGLEIHPWGDQLLPYIKNTDIFQCPTLGSPYGLYRSGPVNPDNSVIPGIEYRGSYFLNGLGIMNRTVSRYQYPSQTLLMCDGPGGTTTNMFAVAVIDEAALQGYIDARHDNGCNIAFLDGHVKWQTYDSMLNNRMLWLGIP